jgi:uncharacterized membrane-anchored protein
MRMVPVPLVYLLEILLLTARAKGPTIFSISQVADCIFNSFVDPASLEAIRWKYYAVFVCLLLVWFAVLIYAYSETRRRKLEEAGVSLMVGGLWRGGA